MRPQLEAFRKAGIEHCFMGLTNSANHGLSEDYKEIGQILDALRAGLIPTGEMAAADWARTLDLMKTYQDVKTDLPAGTFFTNAFIAN